MPHNIRTHSIALRSLRECTIHTVTERSFQGFRAEAWGLDFRHVHLQAVGRTWGTLAFLELFNMTLFDSSLACNEMTQAVMRIIMT